MGTTSAIFAALVVVPAVAVSPSVEAACTVPHLFGQYAPACDGGYCYVKTPGTGTSDSVEGSFWALGAGDPAVGQGHDNGSRDESDWLDPFGVGFYLSGDWSESHQIDGCIGGQIAPGKTAEVMLVALGDDGGTTAYFAVAAARHVSSGFPEYDFTFVSGGGAASDITLVEIPRITSVSPAGSGSYAVPGATLAQVAPGLRHDPSVTDAEIAIGYRVYAGPPSWSSLRRGPEWTAVSGVVPLGTSVTVAVPCPPDTGAFSLTQSLVFESGFETAYLARPRSIVCQSCPPATHDRDGDGFLNAADPECCPDPVVCDCDDDDPSIHPFATETCNGRDDDCDAVADDLQGLRLAQGGATTTLQWEALAGSPLHDVVRGDLGTLTSTSGDFSQATDACVSSSIAGTEASDVTALPPGAAVWYLVRVRGCGAASYDDTVHGRRAHPRDPGILASGLDCP